MRDTVVINSNLKNLEEKKYKHKNMDTCKNVSITKGFRKKKLSGSSKYLPHL